MKSFFLTTIGCFLFASSWALSSITTKNVVGSPFCGGASISVTFQIDAPANSGNVFTAQLSDKNGSFASPVNIGSINGTVAHPISAIIPLGSATGTKYKIRVVASNPFVIGAATAKTIKINPKPTGATTSAVTACSATLSWTGTSNASSYKVRYKVNPGNNWSGSIDVGLNLTYNFTGLESGTGYDFQVRASCSNGEKSDWSKASATTLACPTPTGLIVTSITTTTTDLNWNDATCADDYSLRYRMFGTTTWTYKHPVPSNILLTGLFPATLYEAQVAARCSADDSSAFTSSTIWETEYFRFANDAELISAVNVFPNPSSGDFTIQFNMANDNDVELSVQNVFGQLIYSSKKTGIIGVNEEKISLDNAADGIYFITVEAGETQFKQSVLVK